MQTESTNPEKSEAIAAITDLEHTLGLKDSKRTEERERFLQTNRLDLARPDALVKYQAHLEMNLNPVP